MWTDGDNWSAPSGRALGLLISLPLALLLSACGSNSSPPPTPTPVFTGAVRGGLRPISGAAVTFFAAGDSGYSAATQLATTSTDGSGSFSIRDYTCPPSNPETYIIAAGGNPGSGNNSTIGMMAVTGLCKSLTSSSLITINELTTVAAQWALAQFTGSTGQAIGTSSTNVIGLTNAANLAQTNLVDIRTGAPASFWSNQGATDADCTGSSPVVNCGGLEKMDAIADIVAACVNSTGRSATLPSCAAATSACDILLACTGTPVSGTTLQAAHLMALNPAVNVSAIYRVQGIASTTPFTPNLSTAPTDWTIALNYTGGGLNQPHGIAVDAVGNVWAANDGASSISEISPTGQAISPSTGYAGGGLNQPHGIALDAGGDVWVANYSGSSISKFTSSGSAVSGSPFTGGGLDLPNSIAVDSAGDVWAANDGGSPSRVSKLSSTGIAISPAGGYTGSGISTPVTIAVDSAGNVWMTNIGANSVSELTSSGEAVSGSPFKGGGIHDPYGIAIDGSGNIWTTNLTTAAISELNPSGVALSPSTGYDGGGISSPVGIAIDGAGNAWVANANITIPSSISEFNSLGSPLSPSAGYLGGLSNSDAIAIDASGNVWVANMISPGSISEFIGTATPVKTPRVACLKRRPPSAVCLP